MNNQLKRNVNNIPEKNTSRSASNVKLGKMISDELLASTIFSPVVLIESINVSERTFTGTIYPDKLKNTLLDLGKNPSDLVGTARHRVTAIGYIPEDVDINSLVWGSTLALCISTDYNILPIIKNARLLKVSGNSGSSVEDFKTMMDNYSPTPGKNENTLVFVRKLMDL